MLQEVKDRLQTLGYSAVANDDLLLNFIISKTDSYVKTHCGIEAFPAELHHVMVDMNAGEFLLNMKNSGQSINIELSAETTSIQEGDTRVDFSIGKGTMTNEQRVDRLINHLINGKKHELLTYRRISW
ncbi:MAG: hypothetical protein ACLKAO_03845 [Alkaliphilus sp.]